MYETSHNVVVKCQYVQPEINVVGTVEELTTFVIVGTDDMEEGNLF